MKKIKKIYCHTTLTALLLSSISMLASAEPPLFNNSNSFIEKTVRSANTAIPFSFTTAQGVHNSTCTLQNGGAFALVIYAYPNNSCGFSMQSAQLVINNPPGYSFILQALTSYHLTNLAITKINNDFYTYNNFYPQSIQLSQVYCTGSPNTGSASISPSGCWVCANSPNNGTATCATSIDNNMTVTFP